VPFFLEVRSMSILPRLREIQAEIRSALTAGMAAKALSSGRGDPLKIKNKPFDNDVKYSFSV
jgi:hypothetical protein